MKRSMQWMTAGLLAAMLAPGAPVQAALSESRAEVRDADRPSDGNAFQRVGDWFATVGKPPEERERILADRRMRRSMERAGDQLERTAENAGGQLERAADKTGAAREDTGRRLSDSTP